MGTTKQGTRVVCEPGRNEYVVNVLLDDLVVGRVAIRAVSGLGVVALWFTDVREALSGRCDPYSGRCAGPSYLADAVNAAVAAAVQSADRLGL